MNNNDEDDWFTICDEKHIILEKNSSNAYKITFSIHSTGGEDTVLNVLKNGQLFELLAALNPDVIDTINVTEHANNVHDVFITFKNNSNKDGEELDKIIDVYFSLKYKFKENKCIITSNYIQDNDKNKNDNSESDSKFKKDGREFLPVSRINLKAVEKNNKTSMCLIFKVDSKKSSNIINMYIGLYFKKIFYRFKQYFE